MFYRTLALSALLSLGACQKSPPPQQSTEVAVQGLHAAALNDEGTFAVISSINHQSSLWRIEDGERLFNWQHSDNEFMSVIAADFDPQKRFVLTAEPNTLVLWDVQSGKGERFWTAPGEVLDVALAPNAGFALLGMDTHQAIIFDVQRGGILHSLNHSNRVRSVDLSADGTRAVSGSEDYTAMCWNTRKGQALQKYQHQDDVQLVRISADGSLVLSVSKYDKAVVWQCETGEVVGEIALEAQRIKRGVRFTAARFSNDNRHLLTGRPDQWLELWSLDTMKVLARWQVPKREKWKPTGAAILDVTFTESGDYLAVASNGFIHRFRKEPN